MSYEFLAMLLITVPVGAICGLIGVHWAVAGLLGGFLTYTFVIPVAKWLEKINEKEKTNG